MEVSIFDLFSIGIGPSSSHTVGPMRAASNFGRTAKDDLGGDLQRIEVSLYGSLGATARGHGSDKAIILGLMGLRPRTVDVDKVDALMDEVRSSGQLQVDGTHCIAFNQETDLLLIAREQLPFHPNGMQFKAFDSSGTMKLSQIYYSVGGGFIVTEDEANADAFKDTHGKAKVPYPFASARQLLVYCQKEGKSISEIMMENEQTWRSKQEIRSELLEIWQVMQDCVTRGCSINGEMPGLKVKRRAADMYKQLSSTPEQALRDPLTVIDWVNLYALAVNEENATGGRVVTAPTNGAAGIVPAVMHYYTRFCSSHTPDEDAIRFLLTAGAVGTLFKKNASISGAEVGCQGEVGSACAMAAAGLAEVMGGTPAQVENAAEIGMEHNLGLTCDPIGGLVQVPCIERNAMGAVKAINATRLALRGDGEHFVSLDKVIRTMRITGRDMQSKYKETAEGGLAKVIRVAANVVDC